MLISDLEDSGRSADRGRKQHPIGIGRAQPCPGLHTAVLAVLAFHEEGVVMLAGQEPSWCWFTKGARLLFLLQP